MLSGSRWPLKPEELANPVVRAVVIAMRDGDREAFFVAFAPKAELTDDGTPQVLKEWAEREIFRAHGHLEVEREDKDGLCLVGPFHSDRWGKFETVWRFEIGHGLVRRLDVAAE